MSFLKKALKKGTGLVKKVSKVSTKVLSSVSKVTAVAAKLSKNVPFVGDKVGGALSLASKGSNLASKATGGTDKLLSKTKLLKDVSNAASKGKEINSTLKSGSSSNKQSSSDFSPKRSNFTENYSPSRKGDVDTLKTYVNTVEDRQEVKNSITEKQSFFDWFMNGKR